MCGFAGYILGNTSWQNKQETSKDLFTVANQIFHRGPDARDFFISEYHKIGVAFQRLSILDLSKDAMQPMVSHCKKWVMVFNGEIYNFKNLKKNLSHRKIAWNTNSDTEVILELISYFGFEKAIPMLDGMFSIMAFSLSDRSCWLARDKFGEKPLYYCKDKENNFFFSSDLKALMSSKYYNKKIDYKVSVDYLRYGFVPDPLCILENTYKLSPGMILKLNAEKTIKTDQYWNTFLEFAKARETPYLGSYNHAKQEVKLRIQYATQSRLVSDVPVGAFLSGGIDSSNLVLSLMKNGIDLNTFSIGFMDKIKNESPYAKEVAHILNTKHYQKNLNDEDSIKIIPDVVKYYDEPFSDPSQIPTFLLSKFAKNKIKVAISGDGADELFGGYPRYKSTSELWNRLCHPSYKVFQKLHKLSYIFSGSNSKVLRSIGKKIRKIGHSNLENLYNDQLSRWRPDEGIYDSNITNKTFFNKNFPSNKSISDFRYLLFRDLVTYLPGNLLVKIDRASMANSLEVRSPYLEPNLVKFVWSLPDEYIHNNNTDKIILRDILAENFSENIFARKKQGFEPPLDSWLRGPLNEWAQNIISSSDDIINTKRLKLFYESFLKGENKLTYKLWSLIMFKAWRENNAL